VSIGDRRPSRIQHAGSEIVENAFEIRGRVFGHPAAFISGSGKPVAVKDALRHPCSSGRALIDPMVPGAGEANRLSCLIRVSVEERDMNENGRKEHVNRRSILGAAAAAISAGATFPFLGSAQSRAEVRPGEANHSIDNPGPVNKTLAQENASSELPPSTDSGDVNTLHSGIHSIWLTAEYRTVDGRGR
jgi:hypothetical protein